jgi:CO/xanthine dehydrogenase Mo-binding subunit
VAKVAVIVPYLGGGYGGKVYPKVEPITVALSQKAGRPVRLVLSREEVFYTITKHAAVIRMKTGVKRTAHESRASANPSRYRRLR